MAINESVDEYWNSEFTSSERQFFQKCARTLLKKTFIVRDKDEENRKMFYFANKNSDFFSQYFSFMGFEVLVQKDSGVVMLSNLMNENISASVAVNRFRFKNIESIVLCCLWILLSDRFHHGFLDKVIKITLSDLTMELEKYDFKKPFDKGPLNEILKLFCKFNLIGLSGEIGEEDFTIILYSLLQFALNESEFVSFVKDVEKKMKGIDDEGQESDNTMIQENEVDESELDSFDMEIEAGEDNL